MKLAEDELLRLSKEGNTAAFEELVARYERKVYSIAYRFMGSAEDAADMAQEAFLRLYKTLPKYRGEASFSTWLYHIVANICRDELRKKGRLNYVMLEDNPGWGNQGGTSLEDVVLEREEQQYLHKLVLGLPDEQRVIMVMREMMGFSYEEIAGVLSCSLGTVKSRISRSRKSLRDKILGDKVITVGVMKGGSQQ